VIPVPIFISHDFDGANQLFSSGMAAIAAEICTWNLILYRCYDQLSDTD
jgi:hypothetical protein